VGILKLRIGQVSADSEAGLNPELIKRETIYTRASIIVLGFRHGKPLSSKTPGPKVSALNPHRPPPAAFGQPQRIAPPAILIMQTYLYISDPTFSTSLYLLQKIDLI
jgi:hypothetical protein